jgi:LacI family transcriptional regulator
MERVNIKKLAQLLNVSTSTISKALKDSHEIGSETKKRVKELADKLNYKPNASASSLRRNSSKTIGVIIPSITNSFYALAIDGIESVAKAKGYHVLIYITYEEYQAEVDSIDQLQNGRVDGVILSLSQNTTNFNHLVKLENNGIPLVFFDRVGEGMNLPWVTVNNYESGFAATEHLIKKGCNRIAYLSYAQHLSTTKNRLNGYLAALKKYNISPNPAWVVECTNNYEENFRLIKQLLLDENKPNGIFSCIERLALITYHVCREIKLKVPEDLKIISFSNLQTASLLNPSLSTMTPDAFEIGKKTAAILFENIEKKNFLGKIQQVTVPAALMERDSSKQ